MGPEAQALALPGSLSGLWLLTLRYRESKQSRLKSSRVLMESANERGERGTSLPPTRCLAVTAHKLEENVEAEVRSCNSRAQFKSHIYHILAG